MVRLTLRDLDLSDCIVTTKQGHYCVYNAHLVKDSGVWYTVKAYTVGSREEAAQLLEKANRLTTIKHPRIIAPAGVDFDGNEVSLIMPSIEYPILRKVISSKRGHPWSESTLLGYFHQLLEVFNYLEETKVDAWIGPDCVFVQEHQGNQLDFYVGNISPRIVEHQSLMLNSVTHRCKDLIYMSPARRAQLFEDPMRSDVFTVGIIFFFMASLEEPSIGDQQLERKIDKLNYSDNLKTLLKNMTAVNEVDRLSFEAARKNVMAMTRSRFKSMAVLGGLFTLCAALIVKLY